jgi:cyclohexanone monooxygenase
MASNEPPIPPAGDLLDVAIVGAGLSGIGAAMQLQQKCPGKRFAILEARAAIGGTWDLFRYPGIRSDSDMYTLGYLGKPWRDAKAIADGPAIRAYIEEAADEHGLRRHIRFGRKVTAASWSSAEACWTLTIDHAGQRETLRARFLYLCSGYYSYDEAYRPRFDGEDDFRGRIVQPQFWPQDLDWRGKQVVVIGSGATAVGAGASLSSHSLHRSVSCRASPRPCRSCRMPWRTQRRRQRICPRLAMRLTVPSARCCMRWCRRIGRTFSRAVR